MKKVIPKPKTGVHRVRCTREGWLWLADQAKRKGFTTVGRWADREAVEGRNV